MKTKDLRKNAGMIVGSPKAATSRKNGPMASRGEGEDLAGPAGERFAVTTIAKRVPYILVSVKFPDPVHPGVNPVNVHVPVIALLFTVPCRVSVLPLGVADVTVNWNAPVILPLKFPLKTNDPVWDAAELKQPVDVVKVRFAPVTAVPLL